MKLNDLKIGTRLLFSYVMLVVITAIIGVISYIGLSDVNTQADIAASLSDAQTSMFDARVNSYQFMVFGDSDDINECNALLSESKAYLNSAAQNMTSDRNKELSGEATTNIDDYQNVFKQYTALEKEQIELETQLNALAAESDSDIERVMEVVHQQIDESKTIASLTESFEDFLELQQADEAFGDVRLLAWKFIADPTNEETGEFDKAKADLVQKMVEECNIQLEQSLKIMDTKEDREAVQEAIDGLMNYDKTFDTYAKTIEEQLNEMKLLREEGVNVISATESVSDVAAELMDKEVNSANIMVITFSLLAAFLGIFIGILMTRSLTVPLKKGVDFATTIANGDLTQVIDVNQKDEIGELASTLSSMALKLKEVVISIVTGADSIANASQQLSSTSQQLSQGSSEQASSVEEVSSTMDEISSNIQQNTENAQTTENISIDANTGIIKVAERSAQTVTANKNIAEKIDIVNDIAFQTNILALNAAVEAARAGEHGKGFAVVAAEVRKLAERSKVAAEEIVGLAKNSLELAESAGQVMQDTLPKIENTTKLVQEISAASSEQNTGAAQVNTSIQQLNSVTQQNAAASEELATSAEEMSSQAEQLKQTIGFFNVGNNVNTTSNYARSKQIKKVSASANPIQSKKMDVQPILLDDSADDGFENF